MGTYVAGGFSHADASLLGRKTFEIMSAFWPNVTDPDDVVATRLNGKPKFVMASTRTSG